MREGGDREFWERECEKEFWEESQSELLFCTFMEN